jgi:hypothetical protein
VLDQAANGAEELVEPAGQLRGFVAAADFQVAGQVAFALGDVFQAAGDAVDRAHDQLGEGGADHGEQRPAPAAMAPISQVRRVVVCITSLCGSGR